MVIADLLQLRRLVLKLSGREYRKLTRPVLFRLEKPQADVGEPVLLVVELTLALLLFADASTGARVWSNDKAIGVTTTICPA